jgi:hypothetical protein
MSGWNKTARAQLPEPWSEFWIEAQTEVPMGVWLDFRDASERADRDGSEAAAGDLVKQLADLIVSHNCTDRHGAPLELTLRNLPPSLIKALTQAVVLAQDGSPTEADDPFEKSAQSLEP